MNEALIQCGICKNKLTAICKHQEFWLTFQQGTAVKPLIIVRGDKTDDRR